MFEARRWRGLAPGLLLLLSSLAPGGHALEAQSPAGPSTSALGQELDHLGLLLEGLGERARDAEYREMVRKLREDQLPVDTFSVGPFRVISLPEQRGLAEEVILGAWEELGPMVNGSEDLLKPWTFLVHYYWTRDGMVRSGDTLVRGVELSRRFPEASLHRAALDAVGNTLMKSLSPEMQIWSGGQPKVGTNRIPWVARELISTPSMAARRCYRGDLEWCAEALGLRGDEGGWERWYTAEERRFYIEGSTHPRGDRETAIWEGCVYAGMDDACEVFLRDREPVIPLSTEARASFLDHALWTGGSGAFRRLRGAGGEPILDRLLAAASVPEDTLLASWRQEVLAARPSAWGGLARSPLSLLFWVVLFAGMAVRSKRWRLG